jgi:hypothetical protein
MEMPVPSAQNPAFLSQITPFSGEKMPSDRCWTFACALAAPSAIVQAMVNCLMLNRMQVAPVYV